MHSPVNLLLLMGGLLVLAPSLLVLFRLRQPTAMPLWMMKVYTSALAPLLLLAGVLLFIAGWSLHSGPLLAVFSGIGALIFGYHLYVISRAAEPDTGFAAAFGQQWPATIPPERKARWLPRRYAGVLPKTSDPDFKKDIVFHTIPDRGRQLLCDVWQPAEGVARSGLAFIYLHGSAWTLLDKDFGTRTFFRHLAQQGHVIMDVAYRLFPETDIMGMVHDAKRAIAWMKSQAGAFRIDPERIVIGGGSAGGHIALLAAYTAQKEAFTPVDLSGTDLRVQAVISLYGPTDLKATYYYTAQHLNQKSSLSTNQEGSGGVQSWIQQKMGDNYHRLGFDKSVEPGMLAPILGGHPDEIPDIYEQFSPLTQVGNQSPPTLIIQGEHDIIVPVKAARQLYDRLTQAGVPAVLHLLPQSDHAFDLILPRISVSAHNAYFDIERFLALQASTTVKNQPTRTV